MSKFLLVYDDEAKLIEEIGRHGGKVSRKFTGNMFLADFPEKAQFANTMLELMLRFEPVEAAQYFSVSRHVEITNAGAKRFVNSQGLSCDDVLRIGLANSAQDLKQGDSHRHFDNCVFQDSVNYISAEWDVVKTSPRANEALAIFGRLLHTVQDFYSHTNWIELHQTTKPVPLWNFKVASLPPGIVSGTWDLGGPKNCPPGAPSHSDLNKDSPDSTAGSKLVMSGPNQGRTLHDLARDAATRATEKQFERFMELRADDPGQQ